MAAQEKGFAGGDGLKMCAKNNSRKNYRPKYNDVGVRFVYGIGCSRYDNCFKCPFSDCGFQGSSKRNDLAWLANHGDGINVGSCY